jgi:hypothetical protein
MRVAVSPVRSISAITSESIVSASVCSKRLPIGCTEARAGGAPAWASTFGVGAGMTRTMSASRPIGESGAVVTFAVRGGSARVRGSSCDVTRRPYIEDA